MKYVYKIIAAAAALAIILVSILTPLVYIRFDSLIPSLLVTLGSSQNLDSVDEILESTDGELPSGISEDIAVIDIISPETGSVAELLKGMGDRTSEDLAKTLKPLLGSAIAFLITFALILICAIVTAVLAFAVKDNRKVIFSSIVGIGLSLMLEPCFKAIAEPFLNGEITLSTLTGMSLASFFGTITDLTLTTAQWLLPAIFVGIIVWTVLYNVTLPEDEKRQRKIMLGEAD